MPVDPNAAIEISAFDWVPPFAEGHVRDLRVRWALEEAGLAYRERLLDAKAARPADYLCDQPFGQVPCFAEGDVRMFESGAIVLHIAERCEDLMPRDAQGRARTLTWTLAALNTLEPAVAELSAIDVFHAGKDWAKGRRPEAVEAVRRRLGQLSDCLGEKDYLEDRFTAGDLMVASVLREANGAELLDERPNLARHLERCQARPAFRRALDAQLAAFERQKRARAA